MWSRDNNPRLSDANDIQSATSEGNTKGETRSPTSVENSEGVGNSFLCWWQTEQYAKSWLYNIGKRQERRGEWEPPCLIIWCWHFEVCLNIHGENHSTEWHTEGCREFPWIIFSVSTSKYPRWNSRIQMMNFVQFGKNCCCCWWWGERSTSLSKLYSAVSVPCCLPTTTHDSTTNGDGG